MFPETRRKTATRILAELMLAIVGAVPVRGFRQKRAAPVSNSALQESMHEYASIQLGPEEDRLATRQNKSFRFPQKLQQSSATAAARPDPPRVSSSDRSRQLRTAAVMQL